MRANWRRWWHREAFEVVSSGNDRIHRTDVLQNVVQEALNSIGLNIFGHEDPKFHSFPARAFRMQSEKSRPSPTSNARAL